jgi:ribosomal protein S18 acetylase RimI-like enzyme
MNLNIKKMEIADIPFFNEVRNECRNMLHDTSYFFLEDSLEWFESNKPNYYTVFWGEERIGYFRTSIIKDLFFVGMDLHKNYRGKGLAKPLYNMFFKKIKHKHVYLLVKKKNKIAYNLYKSLGFIEIIDKEINIDKNSALMKKII